MSGTLHLKRLRKGNCGSLRSGHWFSHAITTQAQHFYPVLRRLSAFKQLLKNVCVYIFISMCVIFLITALHENVLAVRS